MVRLEKVMVVCLVVALVFVGFAAGTLVATKTVKAEASTSLVTLFTSLEWMSFLEKYPEFEATDSNCARLEEKAIELEEGLEYAYAELYLL